MTTTKGNKAMTQNERRRFNKAQKAKRLAEKEARKEAQESHNEPKTHSVLLPHERLPYERSETSELYVDKLRRLARKVMAQEKCGFYQKLLDNAEIRKAERKGLPTSGKNSRNGCASPSTYAQHGAINTNDNGKGGKMARFTEKEGRQKTGHNLKSKNGKNVTVSYSPRFKGDAKLGKANGRGTDVLKADLK